MSTIDERIVSMVFENAKFEAGVAKTMGTLTKLDTSLKNMGKTSGFADIEKAASKVTLQQPLSALDRLRGRLFGSGRGAAEGMSQIEGAGNKVQLEQPVRAIGKVQTAIGHLGGGAGESFGEIESASNKVSLTGLSSALDSVTSKFSVLKGAASVALGNITAQATMKGGAFAKSFTFGPIQQGFDEYSTNLSSIQTILANTQDSGGNLKTVNAALKELNTYSDKTIYNFSQMAKNIGTFTAAGVRLKPATSAIKGTANLAALSGADAEKASNVMYQLSQAIASGKVSLQDWASVVHGDMGGAIFQKALMRTAENMGTVAKGAVKIDKATGKAKVNGQTFRDSIMAKPGQESWLTSDVLTETLSQFTGDLTDAQLAAKGFNDEQIKAIQKTAKSAQLAATEVKTLPQVFDVAKETIGSGWSATFQNIFGDFGESKKTFTAMSNAINGFINRTSNARNKALAEWKKFGGRTALLQGIVNAFKALFAILKPVAQAFRDIFPRKTGKQLAEMSKNFRDLAARLKPGADTVDGLRRTFRGFFAALHIGWSIVKGTVKVISSLLGIVGKGSGGFLNFTGGISDFLVALDNTLTRGGALNAVFDTMSKAIHAPLHFLAQLGKAFAALFGIGKGGGGRDLGAIFDPVAKALGLTQKNLEKFLGFFKSVRDAIDPFISYLGDVAKKVGDKIDEMVSAITSDKGLKVLQTGFLGGIFVMLKKMVGGFDLTVGIKGIDNLNDSMKAFTGTLKTIQGTLHAANLLMIAIAIGMLAASMKVLSSIDSDGLTRALAGISIGMGQLIAAMFIMGRGSGKMGATLPVLAASMIGMATALNILAMAMLLMSRLSWEEIAKGFVGLESAMMVLAGGVEAIGPAIGIVGPALIPFGIGLGLVVASMVILGGMKWEAIGKGVAGLAGALIALAIGVESMGPGMALVGPAMIPLGIGLLFVANAVGVMGRLKTGQLDKGLIGIAFALDTIGVAISAMPPTLLAQAAGLVVVGIALTGIAAAIGLMGSLKLGTLVKGLIGLDFALSSLALALNAMVGSGPGALALMGAAAALAVLAPTILMFGLMPWKVIIKGLLGVILTLGVLAGIGALISGPLIATGTALQYLGLGMMAVAASVLIFSAALRLLAVNGMKGLFVLGAAVTGFIVLIPKLAKDLALGFVEVLVAVAELAPKIVASLVKIIDMLIQAVIKEAPRMAVAIGVLVDSIVTVLAENMPKLIASGALLILNFLTGLEQNIPLIVPKVAKIVASFLTNLATQLPHIIAAGAKLVGSFLQGITDHIDEVAGKAIMLVAHFMLAVATQIPKVMALGVRVVLALLRGLAENVGNFVTKGVNIILEFLDGIASKLPDVIRKGLHVASKFVHAVANGIVQMADVAAQALIDFLNGLADVIEKRAPEIRKAGRHLASAVVHGFLDGFGEMWHLVTDKVSQMAHKLPGWFRKPLGIHSPSQVFHEIGGHIMQGLSNGISAGGVNAEKSMVNAASNVTDAARKKLTNVPGLLDGIMETDPTIKPVLDLTQVKKEAGTLGDLTSVAPIKASVSLGQASAIAQEKSAVDQAQADQVAAAAKPSVNFEQNNYSPEALPAREIYRRTNNAVSQIKKQVGVLSE